MNIPQDFSEPLARLNGLIDNIPGQVSTIRIGQNYGITRCSVFYSFKRICKIAQKSSEDILVFLKSYLNTVPFSKAVFVAKKRQDISSYPPFFPTIFPFSVLRRIPALLRTKYAHSPWSKASALAFFWISIYSDISALVSPIGTITLAYRHKIELRMMWHIRPFPS